MESRKREGLESIIAWIRISHKGFNKSLKIIGKHEIRLCGKCKLPETVQYVLMPITTYSSGYPSHSLKWLEFQAFLKRFF